MPSFSGVLTWETMLSSSQRIVMGTRAPHLSHNAVIPHLTAIAPVRFESRVITPGFASITRKLIESSFSASKLNARNWVVLYTAAGKSESDPGPMKRSCLRRETRPLDAAAMPWPMGDTKTWGTCEGLLTVILGFGGLVLPVTSGLEAQWADNRVLGQRNVRVRHTLFCFAWNLHYYLFTFFFLSFWWNT